MALARTDRISEEKSDTSGGFSVASSAFTPSDNSLIVACIGWIHNDSLATPTVSGGSLTWTERILSSGGNGSGYNWRVGIWTAPVTTGASMTVTIADATTSITDGKAWFSIFDYTGYNTTTPTGGKIAGDIGENGAGTLTLDAAPESGDVTVAIRVFVPAGGSNTTATPGSGWTEIHEVSGTAGYGNIETQQRISSTSTTVEWTDINDDDIDGLGVNQERGAALVIKVAAAAGGVVKVRSLTMTGCGV